MLFRISSLIIILATASFCLAQDEQNKGAVRSKGGVSKVDRNRGQNQRVERQIKILKRRLELDDSQKEQFDDLSKKYLEKKDDPEAAKRRREIYKQISEAHKNNQQDKIEELHKEIRQLDGQGRLDPFYDELESILNEDQIETLHDVRAEFDAKQNRGRRSQTQQLEDLRDQLELSPEQAEQYDELYDELKTKLSPGPNEDKQALIQELMQAADEGDEERISELRQELSQNRANPADSDRLIKEFIASVERFLEPGQRRVLDRFERGMSKRGRGPELRDCFRYASRLVDREEARALRDMQREAQRAEREVRRDEDAKQQIFDEYVGKIRDMLSDEKCADFDAWLEREQSGKRGDDRRDRNGKRGHRGRPRGDRPGDPPAEDDEP